MKRRIKNMMTVLVVGLVVLLGGAAFYLHQPKFGAAPEGARLARIENSPNYINGQFQNLIPTVQILPGKRLDLLYNFLFAEQTRKIPTGAIPTSKTDLMALEREEDVVVWLGHSSYFIQLGGKRILIDPVFSPYASPVFFINKAFEGSNPYTAEDMPEIDYLLISHDHWDHLDYPTIMALQLKIKNVICGLGVGAHFERWGFAVQRIHEADWFEALELDEDLSIHVLPARHFSGRSLSPNRTLWAGFALITAERRIFFSGDSGYGPHFQQIGQLFHSFDLAILENGQYDPDWPYIHMQPEEVAMAAEALHAKFVLPAHAGKFALGRHAWDQPFQRISDVAQNGSFSLLTPMIGEVVQFGNRQQAFSRWWENVD